MLINLYRKQSIVILLSVSINGQSTRKAYKRQIRDRNLVFIMEKVDLNLPKDGRGLGTVDLKLQA